MDTSYVLSCCSTADLTDEHFKERNISYICFHFSLDGKPYSDNLGKSISFPDFYQTLREGADSKTSQVNVEEYMEHFTPFLEKGLDILHVSLSSGISGTINSAQIAKQELSEQFPERKIEIIDSLGASSGYGLFMDKLADLRDAGYSLQELTAWAEEHKLNLHHWFFSTDLSFYVKGGRITKASGWFGTVLHICPLLNMNDKGELIPRFKIRGKKAVIHEIVKKMEACAEGGLQYADKCYISHSDCYEDARAVADLVESRFPHLKGKVEIYYIGTTIGSHTGPGTVALFFWGEKRER